MQYLSYVKYEGGGGGGTTRTRERERKRKQMENENINVGFLYKGIWILLFGALMI